MRMTPDTDESIRCSASGCSCVCFKPGSVQLRSCDRCGHSWVAHAMEKLQFQARPPSGCSPVEVALPGLVFDLSSLVLYGAQAVPVRLKILLDRLFSVLTPEQVGHILHTLGWSLGDYVRGYVLQYPGGKVLDRWLMATPEEELLILKQFLRFGETRPIVELMTLQCLAAASRLSDPERNPTPKSCQSNIGTFIERNGGTPGVFRSKRGDSRLVAGVCHLEKNSPADHNDAVHHFENFPGGLSLLLPFHFPSSAFHCLVPSTKELVPPCKLTQCLRKPGETKLVERHKQEGGRREQENDLQSNVQQPEAEPALKIKSDPDKPNPARSLWHQKPRFHCDQERDLHRAKQEATSSSSPSSSSSHIPTSSSLHLSISSSSSSTPHPKVSHKLHDSSSFSLSPLPSFSSSFVCHLPTSSLHPLSSSSSSLRSLPSSLCTLSSPSPAGGRKGRVCCGVCGKSFYDKGTLKIHYNAVHLKIKHRCTVAGCTMVFSSLRSRNRHSANPNPRLHTGAHRNAHADPLHSETQIHKDKNTLGGRHTLRNGHTNLQHGCRVNTPPQADSPPPPLHPLPQNTNLSDPQARPPPLPAHAASSLGSPPSFAPLVEKTESCRHLLGLRANRTAPAPLPGRSPDHGVTEVRPGEANQLRRRDSGDPVPKKKPRKSSTPVKIEREKMEGEEEEEEEEC
ncbi:zinc finger protein basonuclin-2-like [Pempheris klunzingeri]|uniref:zinc finger protein basonuclin-2-like n=1 Tax=Pempheris klunzingeri TaxID=3127111 RepID=UPI00397F2603